MFKNRVTILITVGVLVAIAIGLQFIDKQGKSLPQAIKAIPEDAAIVIETDNLSSLLKAFNEGNLFKREFSDIQPWRAFFKEIDFVDSLVNTNENVINLLDGNRVTISGHLTANNELDFLYVVPIKDKGNEEKIISLFGTLIGKDNIQKGDYEGSLLYNAYNIDDNAKFINFSFTFAKGLFIFSKSRICVEESIRMLNEGYSILKDKEFITARESAGKNVDANIYLNYRLLPASFTRLLNKETDKDNAQLTNFLGNFAAWTELDFKLKNDAFVLSGFTIFSDSMNNYLNAFKGQKPTDNDFLGYLPSNTSAFIAFNFSDCDVWKEKYSEYLQKSDNFTPYNSYFERIKRKNYKISEVKDVFYNNIEGGVSIAWLNRNMSGGEQEVVGVLQLKDADKMKKDIIQINPVDGSGKVIVPSTANIDAQSGIIAYGFPEPQILNYLFGDAFKPLTARYYMVDDSKLVFAESVEALQLYYQKSKKGATLADDKDFIQFSKSLASESNIFIYTNIASFGTPLANDLNTAYSDIYKKNTAKFNRIQAASIQFGMGDNQMFTNVFINYNPLFAKKSKNAWEVNLDTSFSMKPEIVKNYISGNNEILIQDNANKLMLIDESGKILWKKQLSSKILGNIQQIDLFKNNKLQYMFNTSKQLLLVDRNGKDVEGFPVTFKSPATNGIAVFDYDKDKNYRILVACENKNVYLLNPKGGKVDGWAFNQTQSEVLMPAQHFISEAKDYIVFSDRTKTYIVNRRGELRIDVKSPFEKSITTPFYFEKGNAKEGSRFVTTGKNGDVYFIFLDGTVKKMTFGDFSENHRFIYTDLDGDGKNYFIFTDKNKLQVFNRDKSIRFEEKYDEDLDNSLNIYRIGKNLKYIGVSSAGTNKIYLLSNEGKEVKGFPMQGSGKFSLAKLSNAKDIEGLNLIVGGTGNFLYNYILMLN